MNAFLLATAGVFGVLLLLLVAAVVGLWARTARARRRAGYSRLAEAAESIPERNNALGDTARYPPLPPISGDNLDE